jgi:hypothetical protein
MQKAILVISIFSMATSLLSCTAPQLKVPADVLGLDAEQYVATERKRGSGGFIDESFRLGPYGIADVDRDWTKSKGFSIVGFSKSSSTSGYSYKFTTEAGDLAGRCMIEDSTKGMKLMKGISMSGSVSKLACTCEGAFRKGEVVLDAGGDEKFAGTVRTTEGEFSITALYEVEGGFSKGNPTGYRVDQTSVIAAADVMYPGKVWLGKTLSDVNRDELSCLFAGLMLYTGKKDEY